MALPAPGPDRAAVVTGASSGIGEHIARELHRRGHHVVLVARSEDKLTALADELGEGVHVLPADLTDRAARLALLDQIEQRGLTPDILVNNAGFTTLGPVATADPERELEMVEVDVVAVVDLATRVLPGMVARGRGALLNVSSTSAFQPLPGQAGYSASKAFVLTYTQSVAGELRGTGVTATALCPGPVDTGFADVAGLRREQAHGALPSFLWRPAPEVARAAVDGMDRGRLVVIPGAANRIGAMLSQLTPRSLILPVVARSHPGLKR
jgi:short-subunit dehydrogenase